MRKVKNNTVKNVQESIIVLKAVVEKLPFMLTLAISKHGETIDKHVKDFHEARLNLCKELCIVDEETKEPVMTPRMNEGDVVLDEKNDPVMDYTFTPENREVLNEKYQKLLDDMVEVPTYKIKAEDAATLDIPTIVPHIDDFMEYFIK